MRTFKVLAGCVLGVSLATVVGAQGPVVGPRRLPVGVGAKGDQVSRSNLMAKVGGFLQVPAAGPSVTLINCQSRVGRGELEGVLAAMRRNTRLGYAYVERPGAEGVRAAGEALASTNVAAVIALVDVADYPPLLVAPEARWAVVNVAALAGGGAAREVVEARARKEVWRALGYVMGAANSNFKSCVLKPVFKPEELDAIQIETLCPEPFGKMMQQAQALGMRPAAQVTYRKACEEGWAPAPTNELQKAVWQEVRDAKKN